MEFDFDIGRALGLSSQRVSGNADKENQQPPCSVYRVEEGNLQNQKWGQSLGDLLNKVGERSRRAQGLGKPVTSSFLGSEFRVYILAAGRKCFGLLKVGPKRLYVAQGPKDGLVEINPLCVLDFYVVEGSQRGGMGRKLFDGMRAREGIAPERMAYDRPSPKLIGFLRKHFGLARFHPQANSFVVFDAYFTAPSAIGQVGQLGRRQSRAASEVSRGSSSTRRATSASPQLAESERGVRKNPGDPESIKALVGLPVATPDVPPLIASRRPPAPIGQGGGVPSRGKDGPPLPRQNVGRGARSASPLQQAAKSSLAPNSLVQAMAQGMMI